MNELKSTGRPVSVALRLCSVLLLLALTGCAASNAVCQSSYCSDDRQEMKASGTFNGGSATFEIPIALPDPKIFAPGLYVSYSSRNGNGQVGVGWVDGAGSDLHRCPATRAMDDYSTGVRYESTDRLCLDGMHLIVVRGSYGVSGTQYREELEAHLTVEEHGDLNDPDCYFVVYYDNGLKYYYESRYVQAGALATLTWRLTRMESQSGDMVTYHYITPAPGEMLISEIRMGGHDDGTGNMHEGDQVVRYTFETRPDNYIGYLAGGYMSVTRRLSKIETGFDTHTPGGVLGDLKEYDFDYQTSDATGRSELKDVSECVMSGPQTQLCHTPIQVTWTTHPLRFADPYRYGSPSPENDQDAAFTPESALPPVPPYARGYDYDGDGRVELLDTKPGRDAHLYFFGLDGGLRHDVDIGAAFTQDGTRWDEAQGDFVNLGVGALAGNLGGKLAVRYWDGRELAAPEATDIPYAETRLAANFKGAGETDILQIEPGAEGAVVRYYENEGSAPGHPNFRAAMDVLTLPEPGTYRLERRGSDLLGNGCTYAFVIRNGRIEYIILGSDGLDGVHFKVLKPADYGLPDALQDAPLYFLDINDDGLPDVVYVAVSGGGPATWHYLLDTGKSFAASVDTGVPDTRPAGAGVTGTLAGDLANDGTEEILYPAQRLVDYCITVKEADKDAPWCSGDKLTGRYAAYDLGIYRYAILRFVADAAGRYRPVLLPDANIVAQANLTTAADIRGDGLTNVLSPFDPWFSNGAFRQPDGKLARCPPGYGCGLHVSINVSGARVDQEDAAPDLVLKIDRGRGDWLAWHYYPLSNPVWGEYSVPAFDSPARYLGPADFYFTSSMYVVGAQTWHRPDGEDHYRFDFGGAQYNTDGREFRGFQWIVIHQTNINLRKIQFYNAGWPWAGALLSDWVEQESAQGDDYLHGTPSPDFMELEKYTYDCVGPSRPQTKQAQCGPSSDGSYEVRQTSRSDVHQDPRTHVVQSSESHTYVYDCDGNRHEVHPGDADADSYSCGSK